MNARRVKVRVVLEIGRYAPIGEKADWSKVAGKLESELGYGYTVDYRRDSGLVVTSVVDVRSSGHVFAASCVANGIELAIERLHGPLRLHLTDHIRGVHVATSKATS